MPGGPLHRFPHPWILLCLVALPAAAGVADAQAAPPLDAPHAPTFVVQAWHSEDGLPGNVVRYVSQAVDGFLWVASAEGVVRFDGVRFSGFAGCANEDLSRLPAHHLFAGRSGAMWVAVQRGALVRWAKDGFTRVLAEADRPGVPAVTQVVENDDASAWIARGSEVWSWNPRTGQAERVAEPTAATRRLLDDDLRMQARSGHITPSTPSPRLADRAGRQWVCHPMGGISVIQKAADGSLVEHRIPEVPDRVLDLFEDREGNVWAATEVNGLRRLRGSRVNMLTTADGLTDRIALVVMQDSHGTWWVGGRNGGLARIDGGTVSHVEFGQRAMNRPVSALCEDHTGRLWAATRDGTVFCLKDGRFEPFLEAGAGLSKVNAIIEDHRGAIWFGGFYGLAWWDGTTLHSMGTGDGVPADAVTALAVGPDGIVWAGTGDGCVLRGGAGGFRLVGPANELDRRPVSCLLPGPAGDLWVSTLGAGLLHWDSTGWRRFGEEDGLPDGRLTWLLDTGTGEMWIGSMQGIVRINTSRLLSAERPLSWLRLERTDGLPTRECTGGFHPAAWRGQDGELWFPTSQGVARIHPDSIKLNSSPPPVLLESCRINGCSRPIAGGAVAGGPGRSLVELRFTALTFSAPEKVRFLARIRGLDDRWQDTGGQRAATYASVPAGRYRFEVVAVNGDGVASTVPAGLDIVVHPHFWESRAFLAGLGVIIVLGATGTGWGLARARLKRRLTLLRVRHARAAERARIARDLHDDLGANLTGIALLADLAAEEPSPPGTGAFREIAAKARRAVGSLDEIVWAANPRYDSVASLVDYLSATGSEMLAAAGITLRLDIPSPAQAIALDPEPRHAVFLAVREAFHNIVKHSGAGEALLRIRQGDGVIEITIEDKGRGFDPTTVKDGEGLANLHARMESCGGTCTLDSAEGAGTRVVFKVPVLAAIPKP